MPCYKYRPALVQKSVILLTTFVTVSLSTPLAQQRRESEQRTPAAIHHQKSDNTIRRLPHEGVRRI
ncbi:hypothetical protein PAAG_11591 [Paracoccidioides lutzii Pb01]|uniref:Uncharacterized protein n=1 Tax=Paracoccidioides lutzii (strain ATCC MYA-826 / Pb01) TaxID=502779 RepID=A0A0A2V693_PARBA|nr:hypothetical protein PAAG_11591 [Paracoccidioides lutzii Pb01]KGQ01610.1 hypothetical protein PAAG_11591 [Paracoccidioides lutzii Pb01]